MDGYKYSWVLASVGLQDQVFLLINCHCLRNFHQVSSPQLLNCKPTTYPVYDGMLYMLISWFAISFRCSCKISVLDTTKFCAFADLLTAWTADDVCTRSVFSTWNRSGQPVSFVTPVVRSWAKRRRRISTLPDVSVQQSSYYKCSIQLLDF